MSAEPHGQDLYLRHTDGEGRSIVREHRVWDAQRFLTAQQRDAAKAKEKEENPARRHHAVTLASRADYLKQRGARA